MAPAVLAGSLASIIELADNPPERLPQDASQLVQQPLTLYIARVPGSRGECYQMLILDSQVNESSRCLPHNNQTAGEGYYRVRRTKLALLRACG